ncbi:MAG TPA: phosphate signaling complex protein PhoU [Chitinispirillaceae bacterium]|nr:phosphate signaling complex protein PhoU [Chitinispirillaceae bacterium]
MELLISKEIEYIRKMAIRMATLVEESVTDSINSFIYYNKDLAELSINRDQEINEMETELDKELFECFALKAPVASDLRYLYAVQKINKDLERIGDHAVNIAQSTLNCYRYGKSMSGADISLMASITNTMFIDCINAFAEYDTDTAYSVLKNEDKVDELNRFMWKEVINIIKKDVSNVELAIELLRVSKNLERIADLSTNIAEDVIFLTKAKDIKHSKKESTVADK